MTTSWRAFEPSMMFSSLRHQPRPIDYLIMPSIEFMDCTGDEIKSTELDLEKSTPEEVEKALIEHLSPKAKTSKKEVK